MNNMSGVVQQLRKERDRTAKELKRLDAAIAALGSYGKGPGAGIMSAEARAKISAAQKERWAKAKGTSVQASKVVAMPKRTISAAGKKRIAEAQRARWAKVKAAKKA